MKTILKKPFGLEYLEEIVSDSEQGDFGQKIKVYTVEITYDTIFNDTIRDDA